MFFSRRVFIAPPQAMSWSSIWLTDFSWRASGLKVVKFSKSVKSEKRHLVAHGRDLHLGHHQPQVLHRARPAGAAVADEAGRLVVPLGVQEIDRVLERAGGAVVVLGRHEDVAVEGSDLRRPRLRVLLGVLAHATAAPARRAAAG